MKISTKGRYGLKAMVFIGAEQANGVVCLRQVAESEGISENYLEQLISLLKKAGLVRSIRGAQGGYQLTRELEDISVGEILRALEGNLLPVECISEDSSKCACGDNCGDNCVTKEVWVKMFESVNEAMDSISLKELVDKYKKNEGESLV